MWAESPGGGLPRAVDAGQMSIRLTTPIAPGTSEGDLRPPHQNRLATGEFMQQNDRGFNSPPVVLCLCVALNPLQDGGHRHPPSDAHGDQRVASVPFFQFVYCGQGQSPA